eukprot:Skav212804  [mRNA]  locus=scaffold1633:203536:203810:- [translate_table: standard]
MHIWPTSTEVTIKKGDAEQSVAAVALAAIRKDWGKFAAPPKQKNFRPPLKGKGKGKVRTEWDRHGAS